jgi:hypothetical protein
MANTYVITLLQQQAGNLFVTGAVNGTSASAEIPVSQITGAANAIAAEQIIAAALLASLIPSVTPFVSINLPSATFTI